MVAAGGDSGGDVDALESLQCLMAKITLQRMRHSDRNSFGSWNKYRFGLSCLSEAVEMMKLKTIATFGIGTLLAMTGIHALASEKLVTEDGKVAAKKLELDQELADKKYETATFGMG